MIVFKGQKCFIFDLQAFSKYLMYNKDNNELLLFLIKQMVRDQSAYYRNRFGGEQDYVEIEEEEFAEKVSFLLNLCVS